MGGGIYLSTDKGESWERRSIGLPFFISGLDTIFKYDVYSILINRNNIFACGANGVYLSTNNGSNWNLKSNGLPQLDEAKKEVLSLIINGNNIFAGTRFGVFMSTDNGENWFAKNKGIENLTVSSLAIKENNIYAGTERGIFLSTDDGDKWKNIGFKDTAIVSITLKWNYIFAAGGFYISSDNGNNWTSDLLDEGVCPIIINGEYVFAGTDHSGVFRAKLSDLGITDVKEQEQTNEIKIFPNPASDEFRLKFHSPIETIVQLSIFDLLSNCVFSQALQSIEGTNEKNINCEKLPQGYYYVKINVNEVVETVPLVIVK